MTDAAPSGALTLAPRTTAFAPASYGEASLMAKDFASSGICRFKSREQVLLVLATANELQIPPTVALRSLYISPDGTVGMSSDLAVSLVMRSGEAEYFRLISSTADSAVYETKRVGEPAPRRHEFTMAMAKRAQLVKANGPYDKYPESQLRHRCKMELCRMEYPDVLLNIASEEEFAEVSMGAAVPAAAPLRAAKFHGSGSGSAVVIDAENVAEGRAPADWSEAAAVSAEDPWPARIAAAATKADINALRNELVTAGLWETYGAAAAARRAEIVAAGQAQA